MYDHRDKHLTPGENKHKEFLAIRRAISLNETFVLFVEITT